MKLPSIKWIHLQNHSEPPVTTYPGHMPSCLISVGSSSSETVPLVLSKGLGSSCPINTAGSGRASWFPWIVRKTTGFWATVRPCLPAAGVKAHPRGERVGEDSNLPSPPFPSSKGEARHGGYLLSQLPVHPPGHGNQPCISWTTAQRSGKGSLHAEDSGSESSPPWVKEEGLHGFREFKTVMELTRSWSAFLLTKALQF